jgi:hypothetical protein
LKRKENTILIKIVFFLFSIGITPLSVSFFINIPELFSSYTTIPNEMFVCCGGFILFFISFFLFGPPVKSYIIEHELSHVLFALLSGAKVKHMSLRREGGYIKTDKVNIIVSLAPYSLPLYTIFIIGVHKILSYVIASNILSLSLYFLFGVSLSFHIIATIHYIQIEQPDLKRYGYFSSLIFIFTWSIVIIAVLLALMFEKIEIVEYLTKSIVDAGRFYKNILLFLKSIITRLEILS